MINIDELKFDDNGLIPAVVTDAYTKKVLTLAYMNRESLEISIKEGKTCFFSRSRQKLWRKGETSGNFQHIVSITADCDNDALTVEVVKDGPAIQARTPAFSIRFIRAGSFLPFLLTVCTRCLKIAVKIRRRVHILHIFLRRDWIKFSKRSARSVPRL